VCEAKYAFVMLPDGKPTLLSKAGSDSGKGREHPEAAAPVSVQ